MAKAKSQKSSATLGFEQQIWEAACELWGRLVTLFSIPLTIGTSVLAAIGNTNLIFLIISGSVIAIDEDIKKANRRL